MTLRILPVLLLLGCPPKVGKGPIPVEEAAKPVPMVELADAASPNLYLEARIRAGSAYDPIGQEGLAWVTAKALAEAGAGERSGEELRNALYPTGNGLRVLVDREWVSVRLRCHADHQALCVGIFADVLTAPRFDAADVERLRDEALYTVSEGILGDEEALGYEALDGWLFEGHPYGHPPQGRAGVLPLLDASKARAFYDRHFQRGAITVGVAGAYDDATRATLQQRLEALPGQLPPELPLQRPSPVKGRSLLAIDTSTPVTGFHFGHPLPVTRSHDDWPALFLAATAMGEHRQSFGRLFRILRTARGLNYGDYAYIEPFVQRGWTSMPDQGVLRRQPYFYVWLRPTSVENGAFALKLAIAEVERWVDEGLTEQELEDTRLYIQGHLPLVAQDPGKRLSFALDAETTNTPDLLEMLPTALDDVTLDQVNAALKTHIRPADLKIVAVSGEAQALRDALVEGTATPIVYSDVTPDEAQAARDTEAASWPVGLEADATWVVEAEGIFR